MVTGATSGLGRELALALSRDGWTVLVHGRSADRVAALVRELPGPATGYVADFESLSEVRRFAAEVLAGQETLSVLVNNAGVGFGVPDGAREVSRDGHELRFAVNYLAPVVLTRELLPLLLSSAPSRIVNVGSAGQVPFDPADAEFEHDYDGVLAYRRAKLALAAFTFDLAAELAGTGVTANVLHPASFMPTKMVVDAGVQPLSTVADGLAATLRLVVGADVAGVTGEYFNGTRPGRALPEAYQASFRSALRETTERMLVTAG